MQDWALCLRCDVNEHLTMKIEGHLIDGNYNVFNTARTPNPAMEDESSFFAAKATGMKVTFAVAATLSVIALAIAAGGRAGRAQPLPRVEVPA